MMTARKRVVEVIEVARRIADASDSLGKAARERLPLTSGLSPEGVELALQDHLEISPRPEEIDKLVDGSTPSSRCLIVLAANVCTAPLRALACALASSEHVLVKASRRDPVVAELLVEGLASPRVSLVADMAPRAGDAVHVYGADATIASIASTLPDDVTLLGHGTGLGIAVVGSTRNREDVERLVDDLVPFDGRGCLSPRLVVTACDAAELGSALHQALLARGEVVPRGTLTGGDRAALAQARTTYAAIGSAHVGPHHAVFVDPDAQAVALPPAVRAVAVLGVTSAQQLLAPIAGHVAALGGADGPLMSELVTLCPHARRSPLGQMQKPPLDGPVDLR